MGHIGHPLPDAAIEHRDEHSTGRISKDIKGGTQEQELFGGRIKHQSPGAELKEEVSN